jgi:hypothetical protein
MSKVTVSPRSWLMPGSRRPGSSAVGLAPRTVGTTMPKFPAIDEIIATYAGQPGLGA